MNPDAAFVRAYKIGKVNRNIDFDKDLAPRIGMDDETLRRRNKDIGSYRLRELREMAKFMKWTSDDWLAIGGFK